MHILIKSYNGVFLDVENEIENHNKWKKFNHRYKKPGLPSRKIKQVPTIHYCKFLIKRKEIIFPRKIARSNPRGF